MGGPLQAHAAGGGRPSATFCAPGRLRVGRGLAARGSLFRGAGDYESAAPRDMDMLVKDIMDCMAKMPRRPRPGPTAG